MSLFSYLNNDSYGSSSVGSQAALALQQALVKAGKAQAPGSKAGTTGQPTTSITIEAKRAAAAKADAGKDALALKTELRTSFDKQYEKNGEKNSADLTALSGRALAVIALDDGQTFSRAELAAAKLELRTRDRQLAMAAIGSGGLTAATLTSYLSDLTASREAMSSEEQQLRSANPNLR
jgi:hypothetical protein